MDTGSHLQRVLWLNQLHTPQHTATSRRRAGDSRNTFADSSSTDCLDERRQHPARVLPQNLDADFMYRCAVPQVYSAHRLEGEERKQPPRHNQRRAEGLTYRWLCVQETKTLPVRASTASPRGSSPMLPAPLWEESEYSDVLTVCKLEEERPEDADLGCPMRLRTVPALFPQHKTQRALLAVSAQMSSCAARDESLMLAASMNGRKPWSTCGPMLNTPSLKILRAPRGRGLARLASAGA